MPEHRAGFQRLAGQQQLEESRGVRAGRVKLETGDLTPSCKVAWRRHSQRGEQGARDEVVVGVGGEGVEAREEKKKKKNSL